MSSETVNLSEGATTERPIEDHCRRWATALAAVVILLGGGVLVFGWLLGTPLIVQLRDGYAAMAPSTAALFTVSGLTALLAARPERSPTIHRLCATLASVVALVAIGNVLVPAIETSMSVDASVRPSLDARLSGDMALTTAMSFVLAAAASWLACLRPLFSLPTITLASAGLGITLVAVIGYVFDADALYTATAYNAMALHTAIGFLALFSGILVLRPHEGWVGLLLGGGVGSAGARRLAPVIVLGPLLLCLAALVAVDRGWFDPNFRVSLLAGAMIALLLTAVLYNAALANRAEQRQAIILAELEQTVRDRDVLLGEVFHRVKNTLQQINALAFLQGRVAETEEARAALDTMASRIEALGTVQRVLLDSDQRTSLEIGTLLQELAKKAARRPLALQADVDINVSADEGSLDLDAAIPVGLIANELLENALRHAFKTTEGRGCAVRLGFERRPDGSGQLFVRDNGCGIGEGPVVLPAGGAGKVVLNRLVAQLGAELAVTSSNGLAVNVRIPRQQLKGSA